ncbi:Ms4533A family Cys-rich leader peptide [Antrihabitans cavernicola]
MSAAVAHRVRHRLALIAIGMLAVADIDCR